MAERTFLFTSESVTEGHPDKIADQISDGVLDAALGNDPDSASPAKTLMHHGHRGSSRRDDDGKYITSAPRARHGQASANTRAKYGFDADTCGRRLRSTSSPDIAQGVDNAYEVQHDPGDDDRSTGSVRATRG